MTHDATTVEHSLKAHGRVTKAVHELLGAQMKLSPHLIKLPPEVLNEYYVALGELLHALSVFKGAKEGPHGELFELVQRFMGMLAGKKEGK